MPWAIVLRALSSWLELAMPKPLTQTVGLLANAASPVARFTIGHAAIALGAPLDPFALTCMVLVACLPSASNVSLLSERFGANTARIARIILVSTALSFLTFSAAVNWLA